MSYTEQADLRDAYLRLLYAVDPTIGERPDFAADFANRLVSLTEAWVGGSPSASDLSAQVRALQGWVESAASAETAETEEKSAVEAA
jgi:hypothetical protein